ncbi:PilZ domain-containing protein [Novosphingobium sp.]|uniref:PilZ domain-containing protein n=1 Tax=Novosphingobium sp. TaxID=1874826 RepID=UPI0035AE024C
MVVRSSPSSPERGPVSTRSTRASVGLACEVRQGTRRWQVARMEDLSERGFRLSMFNSPSIDLPVSIRIPGMQLMVAYIRWIDGDTVGCEFSSPLHVAVFEHLARTLQANQPG